MGVCSVRGRITLVVDITLGEIRSIGKRRLILLKGDAHLGLIVDQVDDVINVDPEEIQESSEKKGGFPIFSSLSEQSRHYPPASGFIHHNNQSIPVFDIEQLAEL
jgi:chemotaxis signal transduction protein